MRRISVSVRKITLSKFVFVEDVNSWGRAPMNSTEIEPPRILIIPQYAMIDRGSLKR